MGKRGSQLTSGAVEAGAAFVARIGAVGEVTTRKMFGGLGIFESGTMSGIVDSNGKIFLRGGPVNEARCEEAGSVRHGRMPYFPIPDEVLTDDTATVEWATLAVQAGHEAKKNR